MAYFVYRHIREDKNEVFYIGVGKYNKQSKTFRQKHKRAFSKSGRNFMWHKVVKKSKYKVEIISYFNSAEEALTEETRLIRLYGMKLDGSGILVNLVESDAEIEEKRLIALKKSTILRQKKVYQYGLDGIFIKEYESLTKAALFNNISVNDIWSCVNNRYRIGVGGYRWSYEKHEQIKLYQEMKKKCKKVYKYDKTGCILQIYDSATEAAVLNEVCPSAIRNALAYKTLCKNHYYLHEGILPNVIDFNVKVYDKKGQLIGKYYTLSQAEKELNLCVNTLSVYLKRGNPHPKYIIDYNPCHDAKTYKERYGKLVKKLTNNLDNS